MKMSFIQKNNFKKGYTLLFAVIVSVLVLSIAAFILSVSRKEAILASSARDSIYAFYAADSGLECAVENLAGLDISAGSSGFKHSISCGNTSGITVTQNPQGTAFDPNNPGLTTQGTSTFSMPNGASASSQSGISSCASTSVSYVQIPATYTYNPSDGSISGVLSATSTTVTVTVRGYNIGYEKNADGSIDCNVPGPRKVERALLYTQYQ